MVAGWVVTQPRRAAAMSVASAWPRSWLFSRDRVGYRVRFDDKTTTGVTNKFMTDGMLLREAMVDTMLSKYSRIILDEAHERTLHTDILFAAVKQIQERRNLKNMELDQRRFYCVEHPYARPLAKLTPQAAFTCHLSSCQQRWIPKCFRTTSIGRPCTLCPVVRFRSTSSNGHAPV